MRRCWAIYLLCFAPKILACSYPPTPKYGISVLIDPEYEIPDGLEPDPGPFKKIINAFADVEALQDSSATAAWDEQKYKNELIRLFPNLDAAKTLAVPQGYECRTNTFANAILFLQNAAAEGVGQEELFSLAKARTLMLNRCGKDLSEIVLSMSSIHGKYLEGILAFYSLDEEGSFRIFATLAEQTPKSSWVVETAKYLKARIKLMMAQKDWDGYYEPSLTVKAPLVLEAQTFFQDYLRDYPQGRYADSAKNVERRILYFLGKTKELDTILQSNANAALVSSTKYSIFGPQFDEYARLYKGEADPTRDHPLLIAYSWIRQTKIDKTAFAQWQKNTLRAKAPELSLFLTALYFYRNKDDASLSTLDIPSTTKGMLAGSARLMKAFAMRDLGKASEASNLFLELENEFPQDDSIKLHRLRMFFKAHPKDKLFDKDSPISSPKILTDMALRVYNTEELEKILEHPNLDPAKTVYVLRELARRYLFDRRFAEMVQIFERKADMGTLQDLEGNVRSLALSANNERASLDLGQQIYTKFLQPQSDLGGFDNLLGNEIKASCPECPWVEISEHPKYAAIDYFRDVANRHAASATMDDLEAESLHLLVKCSRSYEQADRCGIPREEAQKESKANFQRLHKKYAKSDWAKATPYFY